LIFKSFEDIINLTGTVYSYSIETALSVIKLICENNKKDLEAVIEQQFF